MTTKPNGDFAGTPMPAPEKLKPIPVVEVERVFDALALNSIVNHPEVYPWVRGPLDEPLDLEHVASDRNNIVLVSTHGALVFTPLRPAIWEVHTQILPEGRGAWAVGLVEAALRWVFVQTDAIEILTRCPQGNPGAAALAQRIGGRVAFKLQNGWVFENKLVPATIYSLTLQEWLARHAASFAHYGEEFHAALEEKYAELGRETPIHEDDHSHNTAVGVAAAMILAGQALKGATFYNRWASMAGYAPMAILADDPLLIDIKEAVLCVNENGDFDVVSLNSAVN